MRSFLLAFAAVMAVVLVSSPSVSNFALAKTYKSGEMPTGNTQEIKKQMLEKARAAVWEKAKKDLEQYKATKAKK